MFVVLLQVEGVVAGQRDHEEWLVVSLTLVDTQTVAADGAVPPRPRQLAPLAQLTTQGDVWQLV